MITFSAPDQLYAAAELATSRDGQVRETEENSTLQE